MIGGNHPTCWRPIIEPLMAQHPTIEHFDVLIVGAGLSGIAAGYHLQQRSPNRTYAILEGRERSGGTWDLFRYPGVRSDSDMHTLGYSFRPWNHASSLADGASILDYLRDTAAHYGIDRKIRFNHCVRRADWSTPDARWTVEVERRDAAEDHAISTVKFTCNFLFMCSGYFSYAGGYTPRFHGIEQFAGRVVHPQNWTQDIDYAGKRVVVIGSGATAVTLVPALAKDAAHVIMLQRSPTYVVSLPAEDRVASGLRHALPTKVAHSITRWKNVLLGMIFFRLSKRSPERVRKMVLNGVRKALGADYDIATHFTPRYNPWDQRLCLAPDGDLFKAIKSGRASVATDHIDTFTKDGIKLRSGIELEADLIVTATGLDLVVLGNIQLVVDDRPIDLSKTMGYRGMMYSDVPNLASALGYSHASWTLKANLTCEYVCRLLNHMERKGLRQCTPRNHDPSVTRKPWLDFTSSYIRRSGAKFPQQGSRAPWKLYENYALDLLSLRFGSVEDQAMEFSSPMPRQTEFVKVNGE